MTEIETHRLEDLLDPRPHAGLNWYRATLRQGWRRQLRRMFGVVEAPIERLVRVRIGPVRIDGLRGGRVRPLKAPEVRGLASGGGRSRDEAGSRPPAR
jgi:16S rRNA U516 pseudouridylate synthase RsuA-like enzyme